MSLRFKSLDDLGRGAWRVASSTPLTSVGASSASNAVVRVSVCASGPTPHDILWELVRVRWPDAVRELPAGVPGRRFRIDIGFLTARLAVEVDGFAYHGKHLGDFKRDRVRQNLMTVAGWRILRFTAGEIRNESGSCLEMIEMALAQHSEVING